MTKEQVKAQIDTDITNKTTSKSISPLNVGSNIKAVVDLIPDITSKEDISNKSINIITDASSDIKYPSVKAVKTYVDEKILDTNGTITLNTTTPTPCSYDFTIINNAGIYEGWACMPDSQPLGKKIIVRADLKCLMYASETFGGNLFYTTTGISSGSPLTINTQEVYEFTNVGVNQWFYQRIIDASEIMPKYKVYTIILNQVGTAAPTAIVLENTIEAIGDLSWTRLGVGEYSLASTSGVFTNNKTYLSIQNGYPEIKNDISHAGVFEVNVYSYNITGGGVVPADNNIFDVSLEIRVYN